MESLPEFLTFSSENITPSPSVVNESERDAEFPLVKDPSTVVGDPALDEVKNIPVIDFNAFIVQSRSLNAIHTKFVNVGAYQIFNYMPGVLFLKQGFRKFVLMDKTSFDKLAEARVRISSALENHTAAEQRKFDLENCPIKIRIRTVF